MHRFILFETIQFCGRQAIDWPHSLQITWIRGHHDCKNRVSQGDDGVVLGLARSGSVSEPRGADIGSWIR